MVNFHSRIKCPQCGTECWSGPIRTEFVLECPGCGWTDSTPLKINGNSSPYMDYATEIRRAS